MGSTTLHGVNLTGWLSLEPWVTPELFAQAGALDRASLVRSMGTRRYADLLRRHRDEFITRADFVAIASRGFNSVRLPVPWYFFDSKGVGAGELVTCAEHADHALDWAEELGLKVIFVLDIAPGSVESEDPRAVDSPNLRVSRDDVLEAIYLLAKRYASRAGFFGLEIADGAVPQVRHGLSLSDGIHAHVLRNYYREAYEMVRSAAGTDPVVIMPDGGRSRFWGKFMAQRRYKNVWLDCQLDRVPRSIEVTGPSGVRSLVAAEARHVRSVEKSGMPVMVGKWSSSLPIADASMTPEGRIALERVYASGQLAAYSSQPAWFFNTWKTSGLLPAWDARVALATFERGLIV